MLNEMEEHQVDWSSLPENLLHLISRRLTLLDFIRFGAVCVSWYQSITDVVDNYNNRRRLSKTSALQIPWMIQPVLPHRLRGNKDRNLRTILSLSDGAKTFNFRLPTHHSSSRCVGSSDGWLFMVDELSEMSMVDPISGTEIALPSITTHPNVTPKHDKHGRVESYHIVWSEGDEEESGDDEEESGDDGEDVGDDEEESGDDEEDGSDDEDDWAVWRAKMLYYNKAIFCRDIDIVAVIHHFGSRIAIARAGDDKRRWWTELEFPSNTQFIDLIYHEGRLYVFNDGDHVAVFDDLPSRIRRGGGGDTDDQSPTRILGTLSKEWFGNKRYIVMSSLGRLLRVYRTWRRDETMDFEVFRMDGDGCDWVQVKNIGDCALFLGVNHSLCLPVEGVSGVKRNCIYFTHDNYEAIFVDRHSVRDIGVFNIEDGTIERYFHKQQCVFPPPLWFMPNLP